jgi:hypothetical protein
LELLTVWKCGGSSACVDRFGVGQLSCLLQVEDEVLIALLRSILDHGVQRPLDGQPATGTSKCGSRCAICPGTVTTEASVRLFEGFALDGSSARGGSGRYPRSGPAAFPSRAAQSCRSNPRSAEARPRSPSGRAAGTDQAVTEGRKATVPPLGAHFHAFPEAPSATAQSALMKEGSAWCLC